MRFLLENKKRATRFLLLALFSYALFFYPTLSKNTLVAGGDAYKNHYPTRAYLFEKLRSGEFPTWTERIFSGYPIYADVERAYLHPINALSVLFFGPFWSYKLLHFIAYLLGSFGLLLFLEKHSIKGWLPYLAANFVYFFTFYHMYHQQHFVIILVSYLLPLNFYLLEEYLDTKKLRYLLGNVVLLLSGIYFGSFQTILMILVAQGFYVVKRIDKKVLIQFVFASVALVALSLPLLLPGINLFKETQRFEESVSFAQGSFHPLMAINLVYPYFFGDGAMYKANQINGDYLIHETYIYVGITTVIFSILGFLSFKKGNLLNFIMYTTLFFLVFGHLAYVPLLRSMDVPVFSMFRYWGRSILLFTFALAILTASFVSNPILPKKVSKEKLRFLGGLVGFFTFLVLISITSERTKILFNLAKGGVFQFDFVFFYWLLVVGLLFILVYGLLKNLSSTRVFSYFAVFLLIVDVGLYSSLALENYLEPLDDVYLPLTYAVPERFENQRIVEANDILAWNLNLYYPSWGIFGYSQLTPSLYDEHLSSLGFKGHKKFLVGDDISYATPDFYEKTVELGVEKVLVGDTEVRALPYNTSLLVGAEYVEQIFPLVTQEGLFKFDVVASSATEVQTRIRNNKNWQLFIDGSQENFSNNSESVYLSYIVPPGLHTVEIKYVPTDLYAGITYSAISATILVFIYLLFRKKGYVYSQI